MCTIFLQCTGFVSPLNCSTAVLTATPPLPPTSSSCSCVGWGCPDAGTILLPQIIRCCTLLLEVRTEINNHTVKFGAEFCPVVTLCSFKCSWFSRSCQRGTGALCGQGGSSAASQFLQPSSIFNQPSLMSILEPLPNSS